MILSTPTACTLLFLSLSLALPASSAQILSPADRPVPNDLGPLDYVEIVGAAYGASARAIYVTSKSSEPAVGALPTFRTDAYGLSGARLWSITGGESAPAVRESDGVIALFANDYQRILVAPSGAEIARAYVTVAGDDVSLNPPVWLPDGRLSVVANRLLGEGRFGGKLNGAPRIWPAGQVLADETGNFTLVQRGAEGGIGSSRYMTRLEPAPIEGAGARVVFGFQELFPDADKPQQTWIMAMDVDRAVVTATLPLGLPIAITDVVVRPDGKIYVSHFGEVGEITIRRVAADLSAVEWTQTFTVSKGSDSETEVGLEWNGMTFVGDEILLVAGVEARNAKDTAVPSPKISIAGSGADPSALLSMLADSVPPTPQDFQTEEPARMSDILLLVLEPETGTLSAEPRFVGTKRIDEMDVFDSRGGRGAVLEVADDALAIVGYFGSSKAAGTASNVLIVPLRADGELPLSSDEDGVEC